MTTADPAAIAEVPRPFIDVVSSTWDRLRELYRLMLPIRFSFLTVIVFATTLFLTDQGNDAIAALAEGNPRWSRLSVMGVQVLFVLLTGLFASQTWYWSRQLLRVHFRDHPDPAAWPLTVSWAPRLLGVAVFGIAIASLANVHSMYGGHVRKPAHVLVGLMLALLVEAAVFVLLVIVRRKKIGTLTTVRNLRDFGPVTLQLLGWTTVLALVAFFASTLAVQRIARIGTISVLVTSFGLWVAFGGIVVYAGTKARIPILTWLLLYAIAIGPLADNHKVRTVAGPAPARLTADAAFANWYARLTQSPAAPGTRRPVFIVATEGGGIRAAYWTAAVLTSLSDTVPGFTDHLFAVSGVSGGSVGAASYRALLAQSAPGQLRPLARETLAYDALAPTISALSQQDFVQRFLPWIRLPDRARALEQGWETGWNDVLGNGAFGNGFVATASTNADRLPSLFLNGTLVESGQRSITSNVRIDRLFAGATDTIDEIGADVPMSTAAHNSARFPYVSPVGTMRRRHIADGGFFDNSGAATASDLVDVVRSHPDYAKGLIRPYVIFISFGGAEAAPVTESRFANELIAPILTVFAVRGAHANAAVAEVKEHTPQTERTTFTLVPHKGERFPLGWLLAARTRDLIDKQMGRDSKENGQNVRTIAAVLGVTPLADPVWARATGNEQRATAEEQ